MYGKSMYESHTFRSYVDQLVDHKWELEKLTLTGPWEFLILIVKLTYSC